MSPDPLRAVWHASGAPVDPGLRWRPAGTCARCGATDTPTVALTAVVSERFTGWDAYATGLADLVWCACCAWGHSEPRLRHQATVVGPTSAGPADAGALAAALAEPLTPQTAVVVPLSRHKHLLPSARWGVVTTDDAYLAWTAADADRLALVHSLRAAGVAESALLAPAPPFPVLAGTGTRSAAGIWAAWEGLAPWRAAPLWMAVATIATRGGRP